MFLTSKSSPAPTSPRVTSSQRLGNLSWKPKTTNFRIEHPLLLLLPRQTCCGPSFSTFYNQMWTPLSSMRLSQIIDANFRSIRKMIQSEGRLSLTHICFDRSRPLHGMYPLLHIFQNILFPIFFYFPILFPVHFLNSRSSRQATMNSFLSPGI